MQIPLFALVDSDGPHDMVPPFPAIDLTHVKQGDDFPSSPGERIAAGSETNRSASDFARGLSSLPQRERVQAMRIPSDPHARAMVVTWPGGQRVPLASKQMLFAFWTGRPLMSR